MRGLKQRRDVQGEPLDHRRRYAPRFHHAGTLLKAPIRVYMHFHRLRLGIDRPILPHPMLFIQPLFDAHIPVPGGRRENLHHYIRRAVDALCTNDVTPRFADIEEIWLQGSGFGETHVHGCKQYFPAVIIVYVALHRPG